MSARMADLLILLSLMRNLNLRWIKDLASSNTYCNLYPLWTSYSRSKQNEIETT